MAVTGYFAGSGLGPLVALGFKVFVSGCCAAGIMLKSCLHQRHKGEQLHRGPSSRASMPVDNIGR